jgi:hypothetical protein
MKIAVDYDGTFMEYPEIYRDLIFTFQGVGWTVGILTGRAGDTEKEDRSRLLTWHVKPAFFINTSQMNSHELKIERMIVENEINMDRDELCCMFKARICRDEGIDILFDDAADKIRMFLPEGCKTLVFKSPTEHNMVVPKWGKAHRVDYKQKEENWYHSWDTKKW